MKSTVYFIRVKKSESEKSIAKKTEVIWKEAKFDKLVSKNDFVSIKLHLGEEGGKGFVKPAFVKPIISRVKGKKGKPFLTDTATLYLGKRTNAIDHLELAYKHGFTFENIDCPVIMADGLRGEYQMSSKTDKGMLSNIHIAGSVQFIDVIIGLGHPTGHLLTSYGGALKNIGMGFASRGGKLAQHSGMIPQVEVNKCIGCGVCVKWCPADAISIKNKKMSINPDKCIGCGECFSVCPEETIKISWDESSINVQKKMVEYVAGILKDKKKCFINFATNITKHCDCMGENTGKPITSDLGIIASCDPVALDQATVDLLNKHAKTDVFKKHWEALNYSVQLEYAESQGIGSRSYTLKEL